MTLSRWRAILGLPPTADAMPINQHRAGGGYNLIKRFLAQARSGSARKSGARQAQRETIRTYDVCSPHPAAVQEVSMAFELTRSGIDQQPSKFQKLLSAEQMGLTSNKLNLKEISR